MKVPDPYVDAAIAAVSLVAGILVGWALVKGWAS